MNEADEQRVVDIAQAMIQRSVREALQQAGKTSTVLPFPVWMPATTQEAAAPGDNLQIILDVDARDGTQTGAQNMTGGYLLALERVYVMKLPPHGAFVTAPLGKVGIGVVGYGQIPVTVCGGAANSSFIKDYDYDSSGAGNTRFRIPYTKLYEESIIVAIGHATWYVNNIAGQAVLLCRVDDPGTALALSASDVELFDRFENVTGDHQEISGLAVLTGIHAGAHTFKLGWWHTGIAGDPVTDGNDRASLLIAEILI